MIRTAILGGLLLVMLSMAYSRSMLPVVSAEQAPPLAPTPEPVPTAEKTVPPPRAKVVQADAEEQMGSLRRNKPTVGENLFPTDDLVPSASESKPAQQAMPATQMPLVPPVPVAVPPSPAPEVSATAEALPPEQPIPSMPVPVKSAAQTPVSLPEAEKKPLQLVPPVITLVEEMPVRQVATPRVMMPRDLALPSETGAAQTVRDSGVTTAIRDEDNLDTNSALALEPANSSARDSTAKYEPPAQFMSREARTRELYRLAREMEDTFIDKLAH